MLWHQISTGKENTNTHKVCKHLGQNGLFWYPQDRGAQFSDLAIIIRAVCRNLTSCCAELLGFLFSVTIVKSIKSIMV